MNLNAVWKRVYESALDNGATDEEAVEIADQALGDYVDAKIDEMKEQRVRKSHDSY